MILIFKNLSHKILLLGLRIENFRNLNFVLNSKILSSDICYSFFFFLYFLSRRILKILVLSYCVSTDWILLISSFFFRKRNYESNFFFSLLCIFLVKSLKIFTEDGILKKNLRFWRKINFWVVRKEQNFDINIPSLLTLNVRNF